MRGSLGFSSAARSKEACAWGSFCSASRAMPSFSAASGRVASLAAAWTNVASARSVCCWFISATPWLLSTMACASWCTVGAASPVSGNCGAIKSVERSDWKKRLRIDKLPAPKKSAGHVGIYSVSNSHGWRIPITVERRRQFARGEVETPENAPHEAHGLSAGAVKE